MLETFFNWIGNVLVEYLFGALYTVLYKSGLPDYVRYPLAAGVGLSYLAIEVFLILEAIRCHRSGNTYLMILCIVGFAVFAALIIVGFIHQKNA